MYFTIEALGCSIKSERGMIPQKRRGLHKNEAVDMLKKIIEFMEEYYAEFSHSEKF